MKKNLAFILVGILVLAATCAFVYYKIYLEERISISKITETTTTTTQTTPAISDTDLINLMISLEDDLGLQEVLVDQVADILEVKFTAPTIGGDELNEALVQIFAYIDEKTPETIKKIRLVFVVNYIDSAMVDLERSKIADWKAGKLDNAGLIKAFNKVSLVSETKTTSYIPYAYAQSEACPIANSHQEGDQCICDQYYKAVSGQCISMSDAELCPFANTHRVDDKCYCDEYYKADANGDCVPMTEFEMCGQENAHRVGDQCICDDGYGSVGGVCQSKSAICGAHNAKYNASIDDCDCNEGYVKNAADDDCIPVTKDGEKPSDDSSTTTTTTTTSTTPPAEPNPPSTTTTTTTTTPNEPTTTSTTTTTSTNSTDEPAAPPLSTDPMQIILNLQENPDNKVTINPVTSNLTSDEKSLVLQQVNVINDFTSQDTSEVQLNPTTEQKINIVKGVIEGSVYQDTQKWQSEVDAAAKAGKFKSESDKAGFESLMNSIKSQEELYKQNVDALNIMHKQNLQYMFDEQAFSKVMFAGDKKYENAPKRDFLKEANGDPTEASVYATQAAAAQYKLLGEIKDQIRKLNEEKVQYLNVRPKPNLEEELKKINIDLYKKN